MTGEQCKHGLSVDQCGYCQQPPPGLTGRVVITQAGRVFHRTTSCAALQDGQRYAARLGQEVHDPVVVALSAAQSAGRAVCPACFPNYRPGQTQRHEPDRERTIAPPDPIHNSADQVKTLKQLAAALDSARHSVSAALAAEVDRGQLTDIVAHALIDIRALVWPNAAPIRSAQPTRDPKA